MPGGDNSYGRMIPGYIQNCDYCVSLLSYKDKHGHTYTEPSTYYLKAAVVYNSSCPLMFEIISQTAFPTVKMFYHLRLPNHLHLVFCSKTVFFYENDYYRLWLSLHCYLWSLILFGNTDLIKSNQIMGRM